MLIIGYNILIIIKTYEMPRMVKFYKFDTNFHQVNVSSSTCMTIVYRLTIDDKSKIIIKRILAFVVYTFFRVLEVYPIVNLHSTVLLTLFSLV